MTDRYVRVLVDVAPAHLDRPFDYRVPEGVAVRFGQRVRVSFSGRRRTGWVVGHAEETETDPARVQPLLAVQGDEPWFDEGQLALFRWVSERYAATVADVLRHALPPRVAGVEREAQEWGAPPEVVPSERPPCPGTAWRAYGASALLRASAQRHEPDAGPAFWLRPLPDEDPSAIVGDLVSRCLAAGASALVLAPDPADPVPDAMLALAGEAGADLRVERERERYRAHLRCRSGHARVAVGERSAVFAPLRDLGLVVVLDEANPAYKERRAPRHHAREVALARGRATGATTVLVGDVPSASLWRLLEAGHVQPAVGDRGEERRRAPRIDVVDRNDPRPSVRGGRLAQPTARVLSEAVRGGGAAVVVAARGGEGSALACRACRARLSCPVCDGSLRPRRDPPAGAGADVDGRPRWECPACGWDGPPFSCPLCGDDRSAPLAAGAGRLATELARAHPDAAVARMEGFDAEGPTGRPAIGVLTRGSVVVKPRWLGAAGATVVVLPDADAFLGRPHLDASEDALRLWMALGRWTSHMVVQTREPGHPAVQALVRWDPEGFWRREAGRRAELRYPPAASLVRLRASVEEAGEVRATLRAALPEGDDVLGPDLDGTLLVKTDALRGTLAALRKLQHAWSKAGTRVRVDVDPIDLS